MLKGRKNKMEIKDISVLVADDDHQVLKMTVRTMGYLVSPANITTATDGEEALQTYLRNPGKFQVVASDNTMPRRKGVDLFAELNRLEMSEPVIYKPCGKILISGDNDPYSKLIGVMKALGGHHLAKPYLQEELFAAARAAFADYEARIKSA